MNRSIVTACTYDCPDACSLVVDLDAPGPRLRGDPGHPITRGFLCQKIRRHFNRLNHPERVRGPRLRRGSTWTDISWEEALALMTDKLGQTLAHAGPPGVVFINGGGSLGLSKSLIGHFFCSLGPVTTLRGGACSEAGEAAQELDFGDTASHDYTDLENSRGVVLWGKNPSATAVHQVPFLRRAQQRGAPIVLIEVRSSETQGLADRLIKVRPGGDGFLALAVLRRLLERGQLNEQAQGKTENLDDFISFLRQPEQAANQLTRAAGVNLEDVEFLADLYGQPGPVGTWVGWGLQRRHFGGHHVRCIDALGHLSGHVGRPGGGVNFTTRRRRGLASVGLARPSGRQLSTARLGEELAALDEPPAQFVYIAGANPVTQLPDSHRISRSLRQADFVVVADGFFTDTAEAADLFLPVALMLEEGDVVGSYQHHYVARGPQAVPPPSGVRGDLWIVRELHLRLGRPSDPLLCRPGETVKRMTAPWFGSESASVARNPTQPVVPFVGDFPTASGKARLVCERPPSVSTTADYPLRFLTPSCRRWLTSQRFEQDQEGQLADCYVYRQPCGSDREVEEGERARLESPCGSMEVLLRIDPLLAPDECWVRRGGWLRHGQGVNVLVEAQPTDIGQGVSFYDQSVRLVLAS
jgi:anaerobic selenocysteine-containing dehydrogenase